MKFQSEDVGNAVSARILRTDSTGNSTDQEKRDFTREKPKIQKRRTNVVIHDERAIIKLNTGEYSSNSQVSYLPSS